MEVKRMMGRFPLRLKRWQGALGARRPASARPAVWCKSVKKKKNDDEEETLENNSNDHFMTVRNVITHTRSVKGPQLGLPCFQEKFDV